jgi:hypothetical protein
MIVNVTRRQWVYIDDVLGDGPLRVAFTRDHTPTGKGSWFDIAAPFIGWELVQHRLIDAHLSTRMGRRSTTPEAVLRLLARIAAAQNAFQRHPAMKRRAMLGVHGGWFPVWEMDGMPTYLPAPVEGGRFVLLGPSWEERARAQACTIWREGGMVPTWNWLASEDSHTALLAEDR